MWDGRNPAKTSRRGENAAGRGRNEFRTWAETTSRSSNDQSTPPSRQRKPAASATRQKVAESAKASSWPDAASTRASGTSGWKAP